MQTIRGTKDILPSDIYKWQELYKKAIELLNLYNYHEIRTPIIENTELFLRSVGNETDIVSKEMYNFLDQSGRNITLRPEGTASIVRALINNRLYLNSKIQKLWYIGPMFRYERPQSGRQRQFHQPGIECIGSSNPLADVEVITIAKQMLDALHCSDYKIEINSIGSSKDRYNYIQDLIKYMLKFEKELDEESKKRLNHNPLRILDSKNHQIQLILNEGPKINNYLSKNSLEHFYKVCEYLDTLNISYETNDKLVRGLDYYNDTTFEITSKKLGGQNTLCGGGRYNKLIKSLGGPDLPGVGCAIGIERLMMLTNSLNKIPSQKLRIHIITQGYTGRKKGLIIAEKLRKANIAFNIELEETNLQKQIKKAIKNDASCCIIIGQNEINNKTITVKWINEHIQETIYEEYLINYINQYQSKYIDKIEI